MILPINLGQISSSDRDYIFNHNIYCYKNLEIEQAAIHSFIEVFSQF